VLVSLVLFPIVASAQETEARAQSQSQSASPSKAQPAAEQPATQQAAGPAVTGVIRNPEASPIPGAIVRITNTDTKKSWVSWTDESGKFEFPALSPGRYHLEASQLGLAASSLDVELPVVPAIFR
jgi:cytoskeletal protein RodZ